MKILLTNDDGINAEGLQSLNTILKSEFETYIIAPDRERSACSNIFTMRDELHVKKINSHTWSVNGFPADCVSLGLHSGIIPEVDLVISGINHGPNLGDDIHFSGTVAGARTAFIFGKPGIAVSVNTDHRPSQFFHEIGDFITRFVQNNRFSDKKYYNINYPDLPSDQIKGVKYTFLSKRYYRDRYIINQDSSENEYRMLLDGRIETREERDSDGHAIENGYISITPMMIDCTDYTELELINDRNG